MQSLSLFQNYDLLYSVRRAHLRGLICSFEVRLLCPVVELKNMTSLRAAPSSTRQDASSTSHLNDILIALSVSENFVCLRPITMSDSLSILDNETRRKYEQRQQSLRAELKIWERSFAANHEGRKANRDEIKEDINIASKYKEYNYVRDVLAGKAKLSRAEKAVEKSRDVQSTPSRKRKRDVPSPRKNFEPLQEEKAQESQNEERTPQKQWIGPTPRREGRVLGLFDLMANTPSSTRSLRRTPGKRDLRRTVEDTPSRRLESRQPLGDLQMNRIPHTNLSQESIHEGNAAVQETPSKSTKTFVNFSRPLDATPTNPAKSQRTPPSTGRRFMLNQALTASTPSFLLGNRKRKASEGDLGHAGLQVDTPMSKRSQLDNVKPSIADDVHLEFATPTFLRQRPVTSFHQPHALDAIAEDAEEEDEAQPTPSKRIRTLTRSHTAPVPFGNNVGFGYPRARRKPISRTLSQLLKDIKEEEETRLDEEEAVFDEVVNGRVQVDDSQRPEGDDDVDEVGDDEERKAPGRWRKKGAKRQTRKAVLKPKPSMPQPTPTSTHTGSESLSSLQDNVTIQKQGSDDQDPKQNKDWETTTSKKRKLNPLAHANFQKLKIKGKNMKPNKWRRR